jgi:hypothetical protein
MDSTSMMILETLQGLFADKLIEDDRAPIATFALPFYSEQAQQDGTGGDVGVDGVTNVVMWGLYAPKLHLWYQLILMLLLQTVLQCFFAAIIYQYISIGLLHAPVWL